VPVVDAASLVGRAAARPARFISLKAGPRRVALAVDSVVGVRPIPPAALDSLPPLLGDANLHVIAAIGTLDADLLVVLRSSRLVPDEVWTRLDHGDSMA
jgi:purine-binding chemotaxis protein CheW